MFVAKMIRVIFVCSIVFILCNSHALGGPGSCERFDFPRDKEGKIDWPSTVKVLKQDALVYEDAMSALEIPNLRLDFNDKLNVLDVQENRVQVRRVGGYQPLGWMSRSDLLCAMKPLKDENTGLERKLYIRTATEERGEKPATVTAYPSPDLMGEPLRELSRFTGYFVFDEAPESYLLGDTYLLDDTSRLVGWVSKKYGFIWNTAYGLRPKEEFEDKTVCAYRKLEDTFSDPIGKCIPILGGKRWYKYPDRIPIIDRIQHQGKDFYKVVLPIAATGAEYDPRTGTIKIINPAQFAENPGIESILYGMKNIDVVFLIDGTQSMGPYIDAVRGSPENNYRDGVVQQIIRDLQADPAFKETNFRFGFRIYRDHYAGVKEFGEHYSLSDRCEEKQNLQGFNEALAGVEETTDDKDDFPENLNGGLRHAINDLFPCPNHTKLLFVIGDCGYDANAQRRRGRTPVDAQALIREISGSIVNQKKSFVLFFIQTPNISDSFDDSQKRQKYTEAYSFFTTQAKNILRQLYLSGQSRTIDISNYFLTLPESTERMQILTEKIIAGVKDFSNMEPIHELILDLRGGAALTEAIERLKGSEEYRNIPGLFWDLVEQGSCQELGSQCRERIYDAILDGYIEVSDDVFEDIWLKRDDLRAWERVCDQFKDMSQVSGSQLRETFISAVKESLEKILRKPLYEETREPLKEYLQRKVGLPVRDTSPLFNYSVDDLRDPRTVPDCELIRLSIWIKSAGQMLGVVTHGALRPVYRKISFPDQCPSGEDIPYIDGDVKAEPLGDSENVRYDHSFQKAHVYWVPKEFLP